jgi:hypothetical protein
MDKLLDLIGWVGAENPSIADKLRFLESAFLCGFQSAQRRGGVEPESPDYVVDAGINLKCSGGHSTGKIAGWFIRTKDGRSFMLEHKPVARRRKAKRASTAASSPLFQAAKAGK